MKIKRLKQDQYSFFLNNEHKIQHQAENLKKFSIRNKDYFL